MTNSTRIRPLTAMKAMRRLIADAERTEEVFTIVQALSGNSLERGYRRFRRTPVGQDVLASQRNLIDSLADKETLRALPDNSLGRAYLAFMESENLSADGLVDASVNRDHPRNDPGLALYGARLRDMHDLMPWRRYRKSLRESSGPALKNRVLPSASTSYRSLSP